MPACVWEQFSFRPLKATWSTFADFEFHGCRAVLHGLVGEHTEPTQSHCLSDADGLRASEIKHPVQNINGKGGLSHAARFRPRA
jgi:hypothetical protein